MADEVLFEFLHMEIVSQFQRSESKEEKDQCISKLEALGFRVGQSLIERFTKECPRFKDELDTMKFLCKEFWNLVYKRQIDNLRTNHQGVYVLQDNKFKFLIQMSTGKQYMESAPRDKQPLVVHSMIQRLEKSPFMAGGICCLLREISYELFRDYLAFPCGMIRGALSNLGINCIVTAEVSAMPACKFQIQIQRT